MRNITTIVLTSLAIFSSTAAYASNNSFNGADGVVRHGNQLFTVAADNNGRYSSFSIETEPDDNPTITLHLKKQSHVLFKHKRTATRLSAIDILTDGRVVALSKNNGTLVGINNVIALYPDFSSSLNAIGLEGLAIRPAEGSASMVAILWEGGYADADSDELSNHYGRQHLPPKILLHVINKGERLLSPLLRVITLDTATIVDNKGESHDFRATDLVWHQHDSNNDGIKEWGFIVLLCSVSLNQELPEQEQFKFSRLQRFTIEGVPVGHYIDLTEQQNATTLAAHWKGLGWYKEPRKLILTGDKHGPNSSAILFIATPKDWNAWY